MALICYLKLYPKGLFVFFLTHTRHRQFASSRSNFVLSGTFNIRVHWRLVKLKSKNIVQCISYIFPMLNWRDVKMVRISLHNIILKLSGDSYFRLAKLNYFLSNSVNFYISVGYHKGPIPWFFPYCICHSYLFFYLCQYQTLHNNYFKIKFIQHIY